MESNGNRCPFCGGNQFVIQIRDRQICDGKRWKEGAYARCKKCGVSGPTIPHQTLKGLTRSLALHAFTHPAHLMQALHTYDPVTEIKIKRETGDNYRDILLNVYNVRDRLDFDEISDDLTDLTAALEAKP